MLRSHFLGVTTLNNERIYSTTTGPRSLSSASTCSDCSKRSMPTPKPAYQRAEKTWSPVSSTLRKIHNDPIAWHDGSSITTMSIHLSLAVGTIGTYAVELQALCKDMLDCILNSPN
ncbi:uncharacterized protein ARMOST_08698 [Armillaria ostoyae]|uniref:Uncharacterized protein n=1 Tax=Armillaria ostoyae TaxID=47428 RepID=A0A284R9C0_ARMOS|nr:uncharacterized protein ARMOST_08698 [Armillaria ostoyae]